MSFKKFDLKEQSLKILDMLNFYKPSDIQDLALPKALKNKNLLINSRTGSGKTLIFLLSLLNNLNSDEMAIIILPTNELAIQTNKTFKKVIKLTNLSIYSNFRKTLANQNIIIGTPDKVKDLVFKNKINKNKLKTIVIDEYDMSIDQGFKDKINQIIDYFNNNVNYLFLSATIDQKINNYLKSKINNLEILNAKTHKNLEHIAINDTHKDRIDIILEFINMHVQSSFIIFISKQENMNSIFEKISHHFPKTIQINSSLRGSVRKKIINDILDNKYQIIIASDLLARGIDIANIDYVINYDLPFDLKYYFHRAGRSARFDKKGTSVIFYNHDDKNYVDKIAKKVKLTYYKISKKTLVKINLKKDHENKFYKEIYKKATKNIVFTKKDKKVKPGYKKKNKEKILKEVKKIKREYFNKNRRFK